MNKNKYFFKILIFFGISIILATILVAIITSIPLLPVNTENAWIGYYGGIIGSILTLFGVVFTLKENREQEQRQWEMRYIPMLLISFQWNQGPWPEEENKQIINGNFHDCILLFEEEMESNNAISFSTEIMLKCASGIAQNVMFEVYIDGVRKYDKSRDRRIVVGDEPFYYYINTWQRDVNEKHDVILKIYYQDIFEKQYEQEVSYQIVESDIKNVEVRMQKSN